MTSESRTCPCVRLQITRQFFGVLLGFLPFPPEKKKKNVYFQLGVRSGSLPRSCFEDYMKGTPGLDSCLG